MTDTAKALRQAAAAMKAAGFKKAAMHAALAAGEIERALLDLQKAAQRKGF